MRQAGRSRPRPRPARWRLRRSRRARPRRGEAASSTGCRPSTSTRRRRARARRARHAGHLRRRADAVLARRAAADDDHVVVAHGAGPGPTRARPTCGSGRGSQWTSCLRGHQRGHPGPAAAWIAGEVSGGTAEPFGIKFAVDVLRGRTGRAWPHPHRRRGGSLGGARRRRRGVCGAGVAGAAGPTVRFDATGNGGGRRDFSQYGAYFHITAPKNAQEIGGSAARRVCHDSANPAAAPFARSRCVLSVTEDGCTG